MHRKQFYDLKKQGFESVFSLRDFYNQQKQNEHH